MSKRAVDLSVAELSALGAKAAQRATRTLQSSGQVITGTIDTYEGGKAASSLAQLLPSGTVTLVQKSGGAMIDIAASAKPRRAKAPD